MRTTPFTSFLVSFAFVGLLAIGNSGCSSGGKTVNTDQDTIAQPEPPKPIALTPLSQFDGVIVGTGVRSRIAPNKDADVVKPLNTGDLVRVTSASDTRDKITSGTRCDDYGFFWYNLEDSKGTKLWVYGKFVYAINHNAPSPYGQQVTFENAPFSLVRAEDNSYGISDQGGLTGCDRKMVLFLKNANGKLSPIRLGKASGNSRLKSNSDIIGHSLLVLIAESEGISDELSTIAETHFNGKDAIELKFFVRNSDSEYTLTVIQTADGFEVGAIASK